MWKRSGGSVEHASLRLKDEVRLEVAARGKNLSTHECRPLWRGASGDWVRMPIAQIRYEGDDDWTLYFGDRHGKLTMYFDLDANQPIDVIINRSKPTTPASFGANAFNVNGAPREPYHHIKPRIVSPPLGGTSSDAERPHPEQYIRHEPCSEGSRGDYAQADG